MHTTWSVKMITEDKLGLFVLQPTNRSKLQERVIWSTMIREIIIGPPTKRKVMIVSALIFKILDTSWMDASSWFNIHNGGYLEPLTKNPTGKLKMHLGLLFKNRSCLDSQNRNKINSFAWSATQILKKYANFSCRIYDI